MRRVTVGLLVGVVASCLASPAFAQRGLPPQEVGRNGWLTSYQQAKELAAKNGKPMFVYFRCVP